MKAFAVNASLRHLLILMGAVLLAIGGFLWASARVAGPGYPLDDAWIHQTYARNLAQYGEWSFLPGKPSGGSTAPLWSLLIAPIYLLTPNAFLWTMVLGGCSILGVGWFGQKLFEAVSTLPVSGIPWCGLFVVLEWHMVWAAVSGMETILYTAGILVVFWLLAAQRGSWPCQGLLVGLIVWLRPDGLTLLGPILYVAFFTLQGNKHRLRAVGAVLLGFFAVFVPYLIFNHYLAGGWWPNTFFAKQAEYAVQLETPLLTRWLSLAGLPLVGGGVLLLPGFLWAWVQSVRQDRWVVQAAALWWAGYTLVYALRLPVVYQHGRYLIPAMPVYFILGLYGIVELWQMHLQTGRGRILLRKVWMMTIVVVLLVFYGVGALQAYAGDVAIIQTEMVATAHWIRENTSDDAVIAAHDIGALGFYGERDVVDLAGLISPDVIPFIRDEKALAGYLDTQEVDYLMTFPDWYTFLPEERSLIFQTRSTYAPLAGGENMAVYMWRTK